MRIATYIVVALAFGIADMLLFRRCAQASPIALVRGLLVALFTAAVQSALFLLGMAVGGLLRFELPDAADAFTRANAFVFVGLDVFVMLRMLWPYLRKGAQLPVFDLASSWAVAALAVASGINLLLLGLGMGFVASADADLHRALWPLLVLLSLASYWGIMLGRRSVAVRPRRWMLVVCVLLVGLAFSVLL